MQPLSTAEVEQISQALQPLVGAQLQEIFADASQVGLGFYHNRAVQWVWMDLGSKAPMMAWLETPPQKIKMSKALPIVLFLRAHCRGHRLRAVSLREKEGRVLHFEFSGPPDLPPATIEVRLIPHAANVIASSGEKKVGWTRILPLPLSISSPDTGTPPRSYEQLVKAWQAPPLLTSSDSLKIPSEHPLQKVLQKKRKAQEKMQADLHHKRNTQWRQLGEWLKAHPKDEIVPSIWAELHDPQQSLSWNIENAFRRAKLNEGKLEQAEARLIAITREIEAIQKQLESTETNERGPKEDPTTLADKNSAQKSSRSIRFLAPDEPTKNLLRTAEARGRTFSVAEDLTLYVGKSAADNMSLLRRAQPHDYWLHLRDSPSAHAILSRNKKRNVTDSEFERAGLWFLGQTLKRTSAELRGQSFDLLIVERRFVRAAKGQALGHVHYSQSRTFRLKVR